MAAPSEVSWEARVVTFNMRLDTQADIETHGRDCRWNARRDLFVRTVLEMRPDLLGIQEVMPNQARDLEESLGQAGYDCHWQGRDGTDSEGLLIAVRAPWRVSRTGVFWLAVDMPEQPGSKALGSEHPRIATWAALETDNSQRRLIFLNTHFDHPTTELGEQNRVSSADQISKFLQAQWAEWPAIVVLDSNAEPGAPAHRCFLDAGLVDSWAECHPDQAEDRPTTFNFFQGRSFSVPDSWASGCWPGSLGPEGRKTCHIDWILHSKGLRATACEIDRTEGEEGTAPPSDHFAVIANICPTE